MIQQNRILELLRSKKMVPLYEILQLNIAQYGTRIKELRKTGYIITNHYLGMVEGKKHTAFSLDFEPRQKEEQQTMAGLYRPQYTNWRG